MLETLKKKWWLIAIVIVAGALLLNSFGVINKSAEKILKSQDIWTVTLPGISNEGAESYWKFDQKTVTLADNIDDIRTPANADAGKVEYVDKHTIKITDSASSTSDETITIKFDDLNQDKLEGTMTMDSDKDNVSLKIALEPSNKSKNTIK